MDLLQKLSSAIGISEKIGGAILDKLWSRGARLLDVEEEAQKLRHAQDHIRAVLNDAEQRRFIVDDHVKLWFQELRATAFDVDTLLDRLNTITAVSRLGAAEPSRKRKRLWPNIELGLRQRWELDAWISKINERLEEIHKLKKSFRLQAGDGRRTAQPMQESRRFVEAAAHLDERPIGRAAEKEKIIRALLADSGMDLPVISIWGTAGIGKTALARLVYGDQEVQNFFAEKIWVWLPDRCDVRRATKMIIEAVTRQKCDLLSLDILQQKLQEHLSQRRFLLVIDNLWAESFQFWESLRPSFAGEKGSKILITTQSEMVSRMASNILNINLKGLGIDACSQILRVYAFSGIISRDQHELELLVRRIAEKCLGSPLAAKSIGVLLSGTNGQIEQWESILSDMQFLEHDRNTDTIVATLQISYQHLPYHLKQCFAFCSMFPVGYEFEKDEVVQLWIADGLVNSNGRIPAEMVAGRCFDELLGRSFFETSNSFPTPKFRVPALMHEQARLISKHEALIFDPDNSHIADHPEWIRYVTVMCPKDEPLVFDSIQHYENMRLLKLLVAGFLLLVLARSLLSSRG